ncbi:hypothetical protein GZH53_00800 [Flavihumibacter sp. R14]|nr:hypothetical protein [Flavihumibacter soli]
MDFLSEETPMDSKDQFHLVIRDYYKDITGDNIPHTLLDQLCQQLSEHFYDQYSRFRDQYPKSVKRYSGFQIKDLDHPFTFELIVKFLKDKLGRDYKEFACLLLNMTEIELADFEKNRRDFYNMF